MNNFNFDFVFVVNCIWLLITNYTAQQNILCSSYDIVDRDDIDLCFFLLYFDLLRFPNQLRFIRQHQLRKPQWQRDKSSNNETDNDYDDNDNNHDDDDNDVRTCCLLGINWNWIFRSYDNGNGNSNVNVGIDATTGSSSSSGSGSSCGPLVGI